MIEPATLEQIRDYILDDYQDVILQGHTTEKLFKRYELDEIISQLYEADVVGIAVKDNALVLQLDDSYGNIDNLLLDPVDYED